MLSVIFTRLNEPIFPTSSGREDEMPVKRWLKLSFETSVKLLIASEIFPAANDLFTEFHFCVKRLFISVRSTTFTIAVSAYTFPSVSVTATFVRYNPVCS